MSSGPRWYKSSHSEEGGNNCVEVAALDDCFIGIRHSVHPATTFSIERSTFTSFIRAVQSGAFQTL
ncbi:DUF397 domain-containing protein [Streptomyces marokkonensis]|uniref:DUF397 domain-containing protein n=1 Tax=Streptomyces marokkonensis TaxID=324855 RepID=UPI0031E94A40